ncbi:hypothetical protein A3A75_01360 [Candidatus Woesebacteria bacterium RIFCSPLOWO2_01_FULL_39_10]|uniref:Uncharacterized protein n=1 Tax=Candidatus Woesebacteria bacterium RIFCSPLOWO2_01_FULL_39_10 TaxID=1802516 RepID=A0A1F8B7M6_9BACT|nr:MAG: hypothetical protein A3A75_01360 [Candidatus Woesebacteria bacterium RIFCSPLOWO2_01_FULL_39_10]
MTQVSKYPVSKDVYDRIFEIFLKTVTGLYTKKITSNFFKEFLTQTEQVIPLRRKPWASFDRLRMVSIVEP